MNKGTVSATLFNQIMMPDRKKLIQQTQHKVQVYVPQADCKKSIRLFAHTIVSSDSCITHNLSQKNDFCIYKVCSKVYFANHQCLSLFYQSTLQIYKEMNRPN